jgi:serine/threonine-protein kinase
MSKNKEERFQSAAEFREHLLAASAAVSTAPRTQVMAAEPTEVISSQASVQTGEQSAVDEIFSSLKTAPTQAVVTETAKLNAGVLWGLGTGVAVILVGLMVWLFSLGGASNPSVNPGGITVLNVEGSLYDDAYNTLVGQELLVLRVYEKSDTVPEGVVIRQEPVAGTNVLANTPVTLYVSSGATEVVVPNVLNIAEAQAVALIEGQGLTIGTITVVSSATVPEGVVIASDPAVGQRLPLGSVVNLTLSNGKVLVPDVRNLSVLEARNILTAATIGYTVSIEIIDAATCTGTPGSIVIEQSILPGEAAQLQNMVLYVQCVGGTTPSPSPTPSPTETTNG